MIYLVLKDFLIQKKSFAIVLLYSFFAFIVFGNEVFQGTTYIMGAVMITYLFTMTACATEEKNNSDTILISLPIKRKTIAAAKYISMLIYAIIGLVILALMGIVLHVLPLPIQVFRFLNGWDIIYVLSIIMFAATVYLPFYFKYGYAAIRTVSIFFFLALFFLPRLIMEQYQAGNLSTIEELINNLSSVNAYLPAVITGIFILMLFLLSIKLSERIYNKKDL